jgi:SulP family sulfate permease
MTLFPIRNWIKTYTKDDFSGDLVAGIITAILLVPQGMAFGILAGLPAQVGLYASVLPPIIYALFGTSRTLAVGPVSVAAIMVAQTLSGLPETVSALDAAVIMAFLSGITLAVFGLLRFGSIANFMSHSVLLGFTNAAALLIIASQLPNLIGFQKPKTLSPDEYAIAIDQGITANHGVTLAIGGVCIVFLLFASKGLIKVLTKMKFQERIAQLLSRCAPLFIVIAGAFLVSVGELKFVNVVGSIPGGLPQLKLNIPSIDIILQLLPASVLIALVGYVESVSISKTLANRHRQVIDTNQELLALGAANFAGGLSGGMPVAGGFSRTMVNYAAGAKTQVASIITAMLVGIVALFFTPLLENIPKAALAAIIIVAVSKLIDVRSILRIWRYDVFDGVIILATTVSVLILGIEEGLGIGIALSFVTLALRAAKPHVAVMGRVRSSEHFRNINRHDVETWPNLLFLRVDENLTFANAAFLESIAANYLAKEENITDVILVLSSVNTIDSSALEVLERMLESARELKVRFHLSDIKGPVMDKLEKSHLLELLNPGKVFLSAHQAAEELKSSK